MLLQVPLAQASRVDRAAVQTQKRALGLARAGHHDKALSLLEGLLERYPDHYSLQRDYIRIASWKNDCPRVLAAFDTLAPEYQTRPEVLLPTAECLREQNRVRASIRLLEHGQQAHPRNKNIQTALKQAREELEQQRFTAEGLFYTDSSDAGNVEWRMQGKIWGEVADHLFAYARLSLARAQDPAFATGELNRAAMGLDYDIGRFTVGADLSGDLVAADEEGYSGRVRFRPNESWNLFGAYHSFSEEVPLRGKAVGVSSDQWHVDSYYHSKGYVWEWFFAADSFNFSDSNRRREWYSELTYGFDLQEKYEKRVVLELAQSSNTLAPTVYYNPLSATSVVGGYKYLWVYDSKYKRHADDIYVWAGLYDQQNFGSAPIYGVRYQQDYQLNDDFSLNWYASLASQVYDGGREAELNAGIRAVYVLP